MGSSARLMPSHQFRQAGVTLVELMVTVTLMALLAMLAVPAYSQWIRNNQIRSVAENFQSGLLLARNRTDQFKRSTVFFTTNATPDLNVPAVADGVNWGVQSIALAPADPSPFHPQFVERGNYASGITGITITGGPAALCFNTLQRMTAVVATGVGSPCVVAQAVYTISRTGAVPGRDRNLAVTVSIGGEIRMCDPLRSLAAGQPDGC